jgi:hypothetical protein
VAGSDTVDHAVQRHLLARFARLEVALGECEHAEYFFVERVTIGSEPGCTIRIGDDSLAPVHALIERRGDEYHVLDRTGGGAGVMVNGRAIAEATLTPGDRIQATRGAAPRPSPCCRRRSCPKPAATSAAGRVSRRSCRPGTRARARSCPAVAPLHAACDRSPGTPRTPKTPLTLVAAPTKLPRHP